MTIKYAVALAPEAGPNESIEAWLARNGATSQNTAVLTAGSLHGLDVEWVGIPPSPDGETFDLRAPSGAESEEPRWVEYSNNNGLVGWNYTRNLILVRVEVEA